LLRRGNVTNNDGLCIGCGLVEDRNHLFVKCDIFGKLWSLVAYWLCFDFVGHDFFNDHQLQFSALGGYFEKKLHFVEHRVDFYGLDNMK